MHFVSSLIVSTICVCTWTSANPHYDHPNIVMVYIEHISELIRSVDAAKKGTISPHQFQNVLEILKDSVEFHRVYGEATTASNLAAILTGTPPVNTGIVRGKILPFGSFPSIACSGGLSKREDTIPKYLSQLHYYNVFIGYWKLGLGPSGDGYPTEHGFNYWAGVAYQHSESCSRVGWTEWCFLSSGTDQTCVNLLRQTSFVWILTFVLLTSLLLLKFLSARFYVNIVTCIFSATCAFYILLRLFLAQKSASCVYYKNSTIYEQPYALQNVTLRITLHSTDVIRKHNFERPLFMLVNYLKGKPSYFHSIFKVSEAVSERRVTSLDELDWSVGKIVTALKQKGQFSRTVFILTGGNGYDEESRHSRRPSNAAPCQGCSAFSADTVDSYRRIAANHFLNEKVDGAMTWEHYLKVPLFIKDVSSPLRLDRAPKRVDAAAMLTDLFDTVIHLAYSSVNSSAVLHAHSLLYFLRNFSSGQGYIEGTSATHFPKRIPHLFDSLNDSMRGFSMQKGAHLMQDGYQSAVSEGQDVTMQRSVHGLGHSNASVDELDSTNDKDSVPATTSDDYDNPSSSFGASDIPSSVLAPNDSKISAVLLPNIGNVHGANRKENKYSGHNLMYHYYDLWKPVAVTLYGRYRVVYSRLLGNGELEKLPVPLIFDVGDGADNVGAGGGKLNASELEAVWTEVASALQEHLAERRAKNVWTSEFEMPIYPWLLPCANFPRCETIARRDDFSSLEPMPWDEDSPEGLSV